MTYTGTADRIVHTYAECGFIELCEYLAKVAAFEDFLASR